MVNSQVLTLCDLNARIIEKSVYCFTNHFMHVEIFLFQMVYVQIRLKIFYIFAQSGMAIFLFSAVSLIMK